MTATNVPAEDDLFAPNFGVIEVHVAEINRMFNSMDPSPFRDRDLDPKAEEFIVDAASELPKDQPLGLSVHLDRQTCTAAETDDLQEAVHAYFAERARITRRRLRELFRVGRKSLLISVIFLGALMTFRDVLGGLLPKEGFASILKEGLIIMGWVALWRPLEIFLYDWWPIRAEAKLYDRLATMKVRIANAEVARPDGPPPPVR